MALNIKHCSSSRFESERLITKEWHSFEDDKELGRGFELGVVVHGMMIPAVTRSLPPSLSSIDSRVAADAWIQVVDNDPNSTVLLIVEKISRAVVGMMILFEDGEPNKPVDVKLGYLIAEGAWGKGYATEAVAGFVNWCRSNARGRIRSISAGVENNNPASKRVLLKNGFHVIQNSISHSCDAEETLLLEL